MTTATKRKRAVQAKASTSPKRKHTVQAKVLTSPKRKCTAQDKVSTSPKRTRATQVKAPTSPKSKMSNFTPQPFPLTRTLSGTQANSANAEVQTPARESVRQLTASTTLARAFTQSLYQDAGHPLPTRLQSSSWNSQSPPRPRASYSAISAPVTNTTPPTSNETCRNQIYAEQYLAMLISHHRQQAAQEALDEQLARDLDWQLNRTSHGGIGPVWTAKGRLTGHQSKVTPNYKRVRTTGRASKVTTMSSGPSWRRFTGESDHTEYFRG